MKQAVLFRNMDSSKAVTPFTFSIDNDSAYDGWRKYTLEMVNFISDCVRPSVVNDYNSVLSENSDLKKQYHIAIKALDSIITDKEILKSNCKRSHHFKANTSEVTINNYKNVEAEIVEKGAFSIIKGKNLKTYKDSPKGLKSNIGDELSLPETSIKTVNAPNNSYFNAIKSKFDSQGTESLNLKPRPKKDVNEALQPKTAGVELKSRLLAPIAKKVEIDNPVDEKNFRYVVCKLNKELEQVHEINSNLKKELRAKFEENDDLRDQVHSLECSMKTLIEAINLQDEQLSEYGSVVTSLKNSRSKIIEKMKDANARNNFNIMIVENIEREVEQLRRQLDAYNELLINQNIQQIDKASGTEKTIDEHNSYENDMKKKDNYIALLQDRLCEAIVDLRNKNCEIKNHANSVKSLINNYELEKKLLEERLNCATVSTEKLEEHKIKQQETMKQLLKLIEFLQKKLERINKK